MTTEEATNAIEFTVLGKPATAGSKRQVPIYSKDGPVMRNGRVLTCVVEADKRSPAWRQQVARAAREVHGAGLLDGPLRLDITFIRPRPKSHYGSGRNAAALKPNAPSYPTQRPDVLKLARAIEDSLTGVIYRDDAQVVTEHLAKRWGDSYSVHVRVTPLEA